MTEKYPTWLIGHVKEWTEKRLTTEMCIRDRDGTLKKGPIGADMQG